MSTESSSKRNSLGSRTAWLRPVQNTFARACPPEAGAASVRFERVLFLDEDRRDFGLAGMIAIMIYTTQL